MYEVKFYILVLHIFAVRVLETDIKTGQQSQNDYSATYFLHIARFYLCTYYPQRNFKLFISFVVLLKLVFDCCERPPHRIMHAILVVPIASRQTCACLHISRYVYMNIFIMKTSTLAETKLEGNYVFI